MGPVGSNLSKHSMEFHNRMPENALDEFAFKAGGPEFAGTHWPKIHLQST